MQKTSSSARRPVGLVLTPATRFGSWAWLEKVIAAARGEVQWVVVSYGRPGYELEHVDFVGPRAFVDYPRLGRLLSHRLLLWANVLYLLPLAAAAWWCAFRRRPRVVVANGVASAALVAPLRIFGIRVVLAFHGTVGHAPRIIKRLLRIGLAACDLAFVNSTGSAEDLALVYRADRIRIVRLWADDRFFCVPLSRSRDRLFTVLFVGRQDPEKFEQCLRVCTKLAAEGVLRLRAVGAGPLSPRVDGPNLEQLGYLSDLDELARVYGDADVVWAPADATYLSIPGIEALAAGCPVIVGDIPAVDVKASAGARIPHDLVLPPIGVVVDGSEDDEALAVLRRWAAEGITEDARAQCRSYARAFHTARNLEVVLDAVTGAGSSRPLS